MFMRMIRQWRKPIADDSRSRRARPLRVALTLTAALALGGLASCDKGGDKGKKGGEDEKAAKAWMTAELSTRQDQVGDVKYTIDLPPGVKTKSTANKVVSYWMAKGRWAGVTGPTFRVVKEGRLPESADELAEQIQVSPNVKAIKKQKMKNGYLVVYRSRSGGSVRVVLVKGQGEKVLRCNALYVQTTKPRAMKSAQAQLINVCNSLKVL